MSDLEILALAWFPRDEWPRALERWPDLAEFFDGSSHEGYCRQMEWQLRAIQQSMVGGRLALTPIVIDAYVAWCAESGSDETESRASYAADRARLDDIVPWPPARNAPCWCGSARKYKVCCGSARDAPSDTDTVLGTAEDLRARSIANLVAEHGPRAERQGRWASVRVELLGGRDLDDLDPPPGRVFAVGPHHTFADLADAIELAFGRWDQAHLRRFELDDRSIVTDPDTPYALDLEGDFIDDDDAEVSDYTQPGEVFGYVFDFGDNWRHRCTFEDWSDPPELVEDLTETELLDLFTRPWPVWGWGALPDQYGRTTPGE